MSAKLVVEFYSSEDLISPVVCILAYHGGDNPSSAATTLSDFLTCVSCLPDPGFSNAGLLAARFLVWQSVMGSGSSPIDFTDVCIIPFQESGRYQVARVYARDDWPQVKFVKDAWTKDRELAEAALILRQTETVSYKV